MLDNNIGHDDRPGLDEQYQTAGSHNMRVGNDSTLPTPGDLIAAAGMNKHRMGLALLRLCSEWASSAKPTAPTEAQIEALARSYKVETKGEHAGKVKVTKDGKTHYRLPLRQARHEAQEWHAHELGLLMMNLKSLPAVRAALLARSLLGGWAPDEHRVAKVLLWWLDPKCSECGGARERVIPDSGGRTNGKPCRHCRGTGVEDPPGTSNGGDRIAGYINGCLAAARRELSEGIYRRNRSIKGFLHREDGMRQEGQIAMGAWAYEMQRKVHAAAQAELDWGTKPAAALRRCARVLVDRPEMEWAVTDVKGEAPFFWVVGPKVACAPVKSSVTLAPETAHQDVGDQIARAEASPSPPDPVPVANEVEAPLLPKRRRPVLSLPPKFTDPGT